MPSLKNVESFPQVYHLVASIEGKLREEHTPLKALMEISPGGSITGTPKRKAMEMIYHLEKGPRGIYTGSIGYWGFNRRSSFNISIRTARVQGNSLEYHAGGGIVADSKSDQEYKETLYKTRGLFQSLGLAEDSYLGQALPSGPAPKGSPRERAPLGPAG